MPIRWLSMKLCENSGTRVKDYSSSTKQEKQIPEKHCIKMIRKSVSLWTHHFSLKCISSVLRKAPRECFQFGTDLEGWSNSPDFFSHTDRKVHFWFVSESGGGGRVGLPWSDHKGTAKNKAKGQSFLQPVPGIPEMLAPLQPCFSSQLWSASQARSTIELSLCHMQVKSSLCLCHRAPATEPTRAGAGVYQEPLFNTESCQWPGNQSLTYRSLLSTLGSLILLGSLSSSFRPNLEPVRRLPSLRNPAYWLPDSSAPPASTI